MPEETFGRHVENIICSQDLVFARHSLIQDWEGVENWDQEGAIGKKLFKIAIYFRVACDHPFPFLCLFRWVGCLSTKFRAAPKNEEKECLICKLRIYSITLSYSHNRMALRAIWAHFFLEHSTFAQGTCQFPTNNTNFGDGDFPWSRTSEPVRRL